MTRPADDESNGPGLPLYDGGGSEEYDPWPGWAAPHLPAHPKVTVESLATELRKTIRWGLPLSVKQAGTVLPNLRSVVARSVHPYDPVSRVVSLNQLLIRFLVEMGVEEYGPPARVIFAIAQGSKDTTLDSRWEKGAEIVGYEKTHFRKQIAPKILEQVATLLYEDLLRYKRRVRRAVTAEEPTGDTPSITSDDFTHEEELVSRIWQHVYGWRAELIAAGRLEGQVGYESQAEDHRQAALREERTLRELLAEYTATYGDRLIRHGDAEFNPQAVERLRHRDELGPSTRPLSGFCGGGAHE
jgi:hypothetical protein